MDDTLSHKDAENYDPSYIYGLTSIILTTMWLLRKQSPKVLGVTLVSGFLGWSGFLAMAIGLNVPYGTFLGALALIPYALGALLGYSMYRKSTRSSTHIQIDNAEGRTEADPPNQEDESNNLNQIISHSSPKGMLSNFDMQRQGHTSAFTDMRLMANPTSGQGLSTRKALRRESLVSKL